MRKLVLSVVVIAGAIGCGSGRLQWFSNCVACGIPPDPDAGPGTCPNEQVGNDCTAAGLTCTITIDPCTPGLICGSGPPSCPGGTTP
jgi:hypothetical protein